MELFRHRAEAGEILSKHLSDIGGKEDTVVLGLARGGIPVALRVAQALDCPMDVFLVRKLGVPGPPPWAAWAPGTGISARSPTRKSGNAWPGSPSRRNRDRGPDPSRKEW